MQLFDYIRGPYNLFQVQKEDFQSKIKIFLEEQTFNFSKSANKLANIPASAKNTVKIYHFSQVSKIICIYKEQNHTG